MESNLEKGTLENKENDIFNPFDQIIYDERRKSINCTRHSKKFAYFAKNFGIFQNQNNVILELSFNHTVSLLSMRADIGQFPESL